MAIVRIPDENRTLRDPVTIADYLAAVGIDFERWEPVQPVALDAPVEEILAAYAAEIEQLKARGGYVTADVIDVKPDTPGLDAMLAKFNREHWHDEDEVRFIIHGRGLFHIHPRSGPVFAIEVEAGDLIRVPRGTWHWFELCAEREIRAIRLFQDPAGWTPRYTDSGVDQRYQPICLGPAYIPRQTPLS
ncbi:MAG: cupin domain-containing protein [Acidobacteria bacterium]|nr:cupin domain-containing protein [Acidobacteriota bacterium]